MEERTGAARLRQAITNQATCGSGQFELSIDSADRLCREIEDELARLAWAEGVPAPRDADGEVVPLTTKVMYGGDGTEYRIPNFMHGEKGWEVRLFSSIPGIRNFMDVALLHLHRPDSWERLEEDIGSIKDASCPCDYFNHPDCGVPCYSCPAHTDAEDCIAELARDVLRRAKALAERGAKVCEDIEADERGDHR